MIVLFEKINFRELFKFLLLYILFSLCAEKHIFILLTMHNLNVLKTFNLVFIVSTIHLQEVNRQISINNVHKETLTSGLLCHQHLCWGQKMTTASIQMWLMDVTGSQGVPHFKVTLNFHV